MLDDLKRQLEKHGFERTDRIVNFQIQHGGRSDSHGFNKLTWGVIHRNPENMEPMQIEVLDAESPDDFPVLQCVDADPQDAMFMDEEGRIYDCCCRPIYGSYENMFLLDEVLCGYVFDYSAYSEFEKAAQARLEESKFMDCYLDTVTKLYQWKTLVVIVQNGQVAGVYSPNKSLDGIQDPPASPADLSPSV